MRPSDFMQRNPVKLDRSRSRFKMSPRWTGSFNSYELVPVFTYTDVLPGDTFRFDTSFVVRMSTPVAPVMDDLFMDVAFYFVPHELILSRSYMSPSTNDSNHSFKAFIGAQDSLLNMPLPDSDVTLPYMNISASYYKVGGIADCMNLPVPDSNAYLVNALAPLAFMAVWNENYREPNTMNPGVFSINSNSVVMTWAAVGLTNSTLFSNAVLPPTCRFHGFFGSALPWPQRNSETVLLPLGTTAPINTGDTVTDFDGVVYLKDEYGLTGKNQTALRMYNTSDSPSTVNKLVYAANTSASGVSDTFAAISGSNLVADLANASAVSINVFRLAVQEQRWYEALARGGNRIDELTNALFGVMPKDAGGNQPEYLGGKRVPLMVSQVNATNATDDSTLGKVGAFSLTSDSDHYFTKSFDRWGSIIGVATVRYRDSFGYSLNRMFTRRKRFDFYFPQFANLGEMPVYKHELDITNNTAANNSYPDSEVFGYQEAWADYRTIPDCVSGLLRPGQSLDFWTYANNGVSRTVGEKTAPQTMGNNLAAFLAGTNAYKNVDRTLQSASSASGFQFVAQFQHEITAVRLMPMYSIPGLVDHH